MPPRALYSRFAWAYDDVVPQPAGPSVERIDALLREHGAGGLLVDAGCGTGRYAAALAALDREVIGIDASPGMVERAKARGGGAGYFCADLLDWMPPHPAAAVLCRGVLNDIVGDTERARAFAAFAAWLAADGVLIADVRDWDATANRYAEPRSHTRTAGGVTYQSESRLDRERRMLVVRERWDGGPEQETAVRPWTAAEIHARAAAAGFASIDVRRGDGVAPDRLLVVAVR